MSKSIFDVMKAAEIAAYIDEMYSNKIPYLGSILFPAKKVMGLDLSYAKGSNGLPVALTPSNFDAKATLRDRVGFSKIETEMPFFREAMKLGEKDRQELMKALNLGNAYYEPLLKAIYDDAKALVDGADVQIERMIMQLLSTGKIAIEANRVGLDYDFLLPAGHQETLLTTAKWSNLTNSNPVADIQKWMDKVEEDTGVRPTKAICTRKTFNYLITNAKIKLDMNGVNGANIIMTESMMKQYLLGKLGIQVEIYNKKFKTEAGASVNFFPDEVFTLIPDGALGNIYFGTTPEEADLMGGFANAEVAIIRNGIAVASITEAHPVNIQTVVSMIALPSFQNIDQIFIATVHS